MIILQGVGAVKDAVPNKCLLLSIKLLFFRDAVSEVHEQPQPISLQGTTDCFKPHHLCSGSQFLHSYELSVPDKTHGLTRSNRSKPSTHVSNQALENRNKNITPQGAGVIDLLDFQICKFTYLFKRLKLLAKYSCNNCCTLDWKLCFHARICQSTHNAGDPSPSLLHLPPPRRMS